jgi:hypothetical protein
VALSFKWAFCALVYQELRNLTVQLLIVQDYDIKQGDGNDGLQIWRVAADILKWQSRTADKEWYSSLKVG